MCEKILNVVINKKLKSIFWYYNYLYFTIFDKTKYKKMVLGFGVNLFYGMIKVKIKLLFSSENVK